MLPRRHRLSKKEVDIVMDSGAIYHKSASFLVKNLENTTDFSRWAIIIPKKAEKSSVKRHLLKRKISVKLKENLPFAPKQDFCLLLRSNKTEEIIGDLDLLFKKISNSHNFL